jgi:hypothetical protein
MVDHSTNTTTHQAIIASLDDQIRDIDTKIADLTSTKRTLEDARDYIISNNKAPLINQHVSSSYPHLSNHAPARRPPSNLRHQAILRSAQARERSISPFDSPSLLHLEDFEATFTDGQDVVESSEDKGLENTTVVASTHSTQDKMLKGTMGDDITPVNYKGGPGAKEKRARKRRWQENAAKAREARRRKIQERGK